MNIGCVRDDLYLIGPEEDKMHPGRKAREAKQIRRLPVTDSHKTMIGMC
jgi:hypothetical protein